MIRLLQKAFAQDSTVFPNPIQATDFPTLITSLAEAIIDIGVPLAVVALIFAGFKFVYAAATDDPSGIKEAKKILLWTLVGTAVIVGASALAIAAVNFAKNL